MVGGLFPIVSAVDRGRRGVLEVRVRLLCLLGYSTAQRRSVRKSVHDQPQSRSGVLYTPDPGQHKQPYGDQTARVIALTDGHHAQA